MYAESTPDTAPNEAADALVSRWLKMRQDLIFFYVAIDGLRQFTPKNIPVTVKIQAFCQLLVDYVSAGYFELYLRVAEDERCRELLDSLLARIDLTTEAALSFNDIYDSDAHCEELLESLPEDLSRLGEMLADRFEMEDQLLAALQPSATEDAI